MARRVKVDMTGVESYSRCPEGEWLARLKKIEEVEIQGSGDDGLKAQFEVIKGDAKGCSVFETFSLTEKALWKLKSFLDAAGLKSSGRLSLDLDKLEGKTCIIDVIHDEYNGQKRAKISAYIKPGNDSEDDDEEEDEDEEDEEPKKTAKKAPAKKTSKKRPEPEDDDEDEEEDDEEDEEEEPVKKSKKPATKPAKNTKKAAPQKSKTAKSKDEDEDDDEDDWEEDED